MNEHNYYMVRAMDSSESAFKIFFEHNVVAVGWSKVDFTAFSNVAELREKVCELYVTPSEAPQVVSKKLNEVERFKKFKKGDYIVVPYNSCIAIAEAENEEIYLKDAYNADLSNQRKVSYRYNDDHLLVIPRNELSEGLQRRLRVRGNTVSNLFEFKEEIDRIFSKESYSYSQAMQEAEDKELDEFKDELLKQLQNGKTNLQTGGIGLEKLVCEIMKCEGYDAKILPKSTFVGNADADIQATKEDSFMSKKIFVQVKHHSGYSGKEGIVQLNGVLENQDEYKDYEGYFVTSALIDGNVRQIASNYNIEVMDGNDLVDLIVANISKLSETTKRQLGICMIPHIVSV